MPTKPAQLVAPAQRPTPAPPGPAAPGPLATLVELRGVHKSFGSLRVLAGVSLEFRRGDTTVILGPSGTGKSVLLKHIIGLLRPDRGEVHFDGQRIDQLNEHDLVAVRKRIGFLFQMGALFDSRNVLDNVAFPLTEHAAISRAEREERVASVLNMVGLPGIQKKMPGDLSGGQRKRVALARAVVLQPDLILYDEPTTGLDPITSDVINELIISLSEKLNITSVAVTHDMTSARKIADRMVLLYDGLVVADADTKTFLASQDDRVQRFIQGRADEADLKAIRAGFEGGGDSPASKDGG